MGAHQLDSATTLSAVWSDAQQLRLKSASLVRSVDVHCHCLPGLDDGPESLVAAMELCRGLVKDGITSIMASPHQLGRYDLTNSAETICEGVDQLNEDLRNNQIPLEVVPGGDVRIDERLARLVDEHTVMTCGDLGAHLLLELPNTDYLEPRPLINQLADRGIQTIVTHPERHRYLHGNLELIADWVRMGAVVQITAGSLLGDFGHSAFDFAWQLVQHGLVALVATDAHDAVRRPPRMSAAWAALENHINPEAARLLCGTNPLRVWRGEFIKSPIRL